jgi:hypothetical protein
MENKVRKYNIISYQTANFPAIATAQQFALISSRKHWI